MLSEGRKLGAKEGEEQGCGPGEGRGRLGMDEDAISKRGAHNRGD
jgi:hypothetical protein